jgi:hypothetical protein
MVWYSSSDQILSQHRDSKSDKEDNNSDNNRIENDITMISLLIKIAIPLLKILKLYVLYAKGVIR